MTRDRGSSRPKSPAILVPHGYKVSREERADLSVCLGADHLENRFLLTSLSLFNTLCWCLSLLINSFSCQCESECHILYNIMQTGCKGTSKENGLNTKYLRETLGKNCFHTEMTLCKSPRGGRKCPFYLPIMQLCPTMILPKTIPDVFFIF